MQANLLLRSRASAVAAITGLLAVATPAFADTPSGVVDQSLLPTTSNLTAAASQAQGTIPGWAWLLIAAIVLIAIGIWAVRQPV